MSVIKQFQKALIADYLKEFIISEKKISFGQYAEYSTAIIYEGSLYYLKDLDFIQVRTDSFITELNYLLIEAKSELFHELAELPKTSDKLNLVKTYLDSFSFTSNLLDRYADIQKEGSRYNLEIKETVIKQISKKSLFKFEEDISDSDNKETVDEFITQQNEKWNKLITEFLHKISLLNDDFNSFLNDQYKSLESQKFTTSTTEFDKIKWLDKESHLAYILATLAENDYIETPKKANGDINYSQFAKQIQQVFNTNMKESSLEKYLNLGSDKGQEPHACFYKSKLSYTLY